MSEYVVSRTEPKPLKDLRKMNLVRVMRDQVLAYEAYGGQKLNLKNLFRGHEETLKVLFYEEGIPDPLAEEVRDRFFDILLKKLTTQVDTLNSDPITELMKVPFDITFDKMWLTNWVNNVIEGYENNTSERFTTLSKEHNTILFTHLYAESDISVKKLAAHFRRHLDKGLDRRVKNV
jgi:hypothetical protein